MKGKTKVDGDVGLIFIAYLFTRLRNILGLKGLMEAIAGLFWLIARLKQAIRDHMIDFYKILADNSEIKPLAQCSVNCL